MARETQMTDREILEAALVGLNNQLDHVNNSISSVRQRLGLRGPGRAVVVTDGMQPVPAKRKLSASARKKIAQAQRARWAKARGEQAEPEKSVKKPKRKMSAEGRANIIAATKKRWAAVHKAQRAAAKQVTQKKVRKAMKKATPVAAATPATT